MKEQPDEADESNGRNAIVKNNLSTIAIAKATKSNSRNLNYKVEMFLLKKCSSN